MGPARFSLLNTVFDLDTSPDWNSPDASALLLYNLHYFDDLGAADRGARHQWHLRLVNRWIEENPPLRGVGWDAYPLSLRIVNWTKWLLAGIVPEPGWLESLAMQADTLCDRPEFDLRANHLFANAKALIFVGTTLRAARSRNWLETGLRILRRELDEQILPDGGHIERSPMYHAIVLEDLLDLLNLARAYPDSFPSFESSLSNSIRSMIRWLEVMVPPDGELPRFNDTAPGIAPSISQLKDYTRALGLSVSPALSAGLTLLPDSGYLRLENGPITVLFDVAPIEPAYNPGHAHADTLSFEVTWGAQTCIVNSGTSVYGVGPQRLWERSTAAHSTVQVDGKNSSEVWSGFRVARRACPFDLQVSSHDDVLRVGCSHDGYRRLHGSPVHRREVALRFGQLSWTDRISGRGKHHAVGRIHFHPDIRIEPLSSSIWRITLGNGTRLRLEILSGELGREAGQFALGFGSVVETATLRWNASGLLPIEASFMLQPE